MTTGREYLRVSQDRSGRLKSPAEQHAENVQAAERRGVTLGDPYREAKAVGASRYSRGVRDDFQQLLADIRAGRFGADELWLWESSRGSRKVDEWAALINACESANVHIWVTSHGKLYDPGHARDRRSMQEDAIDAEYESAKISERVSRGVRARAAAGRPHGKHLYGYRRVYDPQTGDLGGVVPDEATAPVVLEVFERFAEGESFSVIARDLTKRGVPTPRDARVWRGVTLLSIVRNAGYIGRRVSKAGHAPVDNAWPAIVPDAIWWRGQARLTDPNRPPRTDPAVKHLLSGLADAPCGGRMIYNVGYKRANGTRMPMYRCADDSCVGRDAAKLEEQVVEFVLTLWDDDARLGRPQADARVAAAEQELAGLRAELKVWQESAGDHGVTPASVASAERKLLPRIEEAEAHVAELRARAVVPDLGGRTLRAAWPDLGLTARRTIIAASVTVTVHPVGRGRPYDPASVAVLPRWAPSD